MLKTGLMTTALAVGTLVGAAAAGVGVVNVEQAVQAHPGTAAMVRQLQSVDKKYEAQLNAMQADLQTKKTEQEVRDALNGKYAPLLKNYNSERAQAMAKVEKDFAAAVAKVRADRKLDAVLQAPVHVLDKDKSEQFVDVTADVQKVLKK